MSNSKEPAFPVAAHHKDEIYVVEKYGLTKREYFAVMALSGLLARQARWAPHLEADEAMKYADALLAELEKDKS